MEFQSYIKGELLILIPVLYLIGAMLKKSRLKNKFIPFTLGIIGVALSCVYVISAEDISGIKEIASAFFTAVTQGILTAGATVYVNQLYLQIRKEE